MTKENKKPQEVEMTKEEADSLLFEYFHDYRNITSYCETTNEKMRPQVRFALENNVFTDINKKFKDGNTLLHYALEQNCPVDLVVELLFCGADVTVKNNKKSNCFQHASYRNYGYGGKYVEQISNVPVISKFLFANKNFFMYEDFRGFNKNTLKFLLLCHEEKFASNEFGIVKEKAKYFNIFDDDFIYSILGKNFAKNFIIDREGSGNVLGNEIAEILSSGNKEKLKRFLLDFSVSVITHSSVSWVLEIFGRQDVSLMNKLSSAFKAVELEDSDKEKVISIFKNLRDLNDDVFKSSRFGSVYAKGMDFLFDSFSQEIIKNKDVYKEELSSGWLGNEGSSAYNCKYMELFIDKNLKEKKKVKI